MNSPEQTTLDPNQYNLDVKYLLTNTNKSMKSAASMLSSATAAVDPAILRSKACAKGEHSRDVLREPEVDKELENLDEEVRQIATLKLKPVDMFLKYCQEYARDHLLQIKDPVRWVNRRYLFNFNDFKSHVLPPKVGGLQIAIPEDIGSLHAAEYESDDAEKQESSL